MTVKDILHETEEKMKKSIEVVAREFATIRTSRASPALVEGIKVEYYGTPTPLKQLATVSIPNPRIIVIQPWDSSIIIEVEKAILKSDLGVPPQNDGKIIRISLPQLSEERREQLTKVIKKMAEDGRVSVRSLRRDANESLKKLKTKGTVAEDESFKSQENIQKFTNKYIERIDQLLESKEAEIIEI